MDAKTHSRGQMFSTEIILSFSLFMAALVVFLFVWNSLSNSYAEEQSDRRMEVSLLGIADMCVLSPGDPQDWEQLPAPQNANAFGLASSRNVLSSSKLSALQSLFTSDPANTTMKMGAGGYGLFLEVTDTSGTVLYNFGQAADASNTSISQIGANRLAILDNDVVNVRVQVWRVKGQAI